MKTYISPPDDAAYSLTEDDYNYSIGNLSDIVELCEASQKHELIITAIQTTVFIIVFFLGVIGNGLVIATFALYRRLRLRCMTDVFLFYLAVSDLLLLMTLPMEAGETFHGSWVFGEALCKLNRGMYAINTYGGLLLLACISVDRYLVVVCSRAVRRRRRSGVLLYSMFTALGIMVTSGILSLPDLIFSSADEVMGVRLCDMNIWAGEVSKWKLWTQAAKITGFCVPCVAMVVCYTAIGRVLVRRKCWRRQKTLRLMSLLVFLFLIFQLPYTVVLLNKMVGPTPNLCDDWTKSLVKENVTRSLAYVRCCLNPLLYALVGVRFRNDIVRFLTDAGCLCACLARFSTPRENGSSITPSSPAPNTLPAIHSTNQFTPAPNNTQTFIFSTPKVGQKHSVISWCHD
ncbi:hypothetical protein DNTS_032742 [Danionella cerebrum]|uniref:G-protein coupled receptors family 1 profile domain-containing protein n=1 Tax=Danionella cerebrum TaxID=2873325 RepID=A0A553NW18_9TELE|nr:hypothetical protein DNTS_032742 [Danionella translucida]